MGRNNLALRQSPEMALLRAIPIDLRRTLFPKGMPSVKQITGDVLLREKLREFEQAKWQLTKQLLHWKNANGFCGASINPLCENRLTQKEQDADVKACPSCRADWRRYAKGEGVRKNTPSSYGLWRKVERAAEMAEKNRKGRRR